MHELDPAPYRAAVVGRDWRTYVSPHGTIQVDGRLLARFAERGLDPMDGMAAMLHLARRADPGGEPSQREVHLRSAHSPNPLAGVTVHLCWVDGQVYVSEQQFVPYD
jgi:hypothetical protein